MASSQNSSSRQPERRYVLADNFRPRPNHDIERTESSFGAPTPAVRRDTGKTGAGADDDLQNSIKAAMAAFGN